LVRLKTWVLIFGGAVLLGVRSRGKPVLQASVRELIESSTVQRHCKFCLHFCKSLPQTGSGSFLERSPGTGWGRNWCKEAMGPCGVRVGEEICPAADGMMDVPDPVWMVREATLNGNV
jgi:hypothetical protein